MTARPAAGPALLAAIAAALVAACAWRGATPAPRDHTRPEERAHLSNMRRLTAGGTNAEAYWAFDDRRLILQVTRPPEAECDQMVVLDVETGETRQITRSGRTTCGFWVPGQERVIFASTHATSAECPPRIDRSRGYAWPVHASYEIYSAAPDGSDLVNLTNSPGYDAEATISRLGRVVFTSSRSGDLDLWTMATDGSDLRQVTDRLGYDGGAFFSHDGKKLVWRATRFDGDEERAAYQADLAAGLVRPGKMELFIADADGGNIRALTGNGAANFAPYFTPDDRQIIFSSNMGSAAGTNFDLWLVAVEGGVPEQVTFTEPGFEAFPMFSWDGRRIAFTSGRDARKPGDLDVFVADWTP